MVPTHQLFNLPLNLLFSTLEACSIFPSADREDLYTIIYLAVKSRTDPEQIQNKPRTNPDRIQNRPGWIWQSDLNFLTSVFIYVSSKLFPLKHRGLGLNRHTSLQLGEVWYLHMLSLEILHFFITEVSELQAVLGSELCFHDSSGCCFVLRRRQAGSAVNWLAGNGQ